MSKSAGNNKDIRSAIKKIEAQGASVTRTKNGHWCAKLNVYKILDGQDRPGVVHISSTPSDQRAWRRIEQDLRNKLGISVSLP